MIVTLASVAPAKLLGRSYLREWSLRLLFGSLVFLFGASASWSQELSEYKLKAAFLYNFAVFTDWPSYVTSPLNLCVYGKDPFDDDLDKLNGKKIGSRTIAVHRNVRLDQIKSCQVVFIPNNDVGRLSSVIDMLQGSPTLVVAESPGATQMGAALNMTMAQGRIVFEANLKAAQKAGLNLSSKMLRLAVEVIQ